MADPLAALADREVPERTNFFDPNAAQTIMSRYANTRRTGEALADSYGRVSKIQDDASEERRKLILFDRDEQDYQDKQEFKTRRGEFLRSLNTLNPQDPDYTQKRNQILAEMPPGARDDDAATAIMSSLDSDYRSLQTEREMQMRREEQYGYQMQGFREKEEVKSEGWKEREAIRQQNKSAYQGTVERLKNARAGLDPKRAAELADDPELAAYESALAQRAAKSSDARERMDYAAQLSGTKEERRDRMRFALEGVSPEKINSFRKEDGSMDWEALAYATGETKRDIAEQTAIRREGRSEEATIRKEQRKLKDENKRSPSEKTALKMAGDLIYDDVAFPTQLSALSRKYPKLSVSDLKEKPEYRAAKEYDANRKEYEMGSALNAKTADAYVRLVTHFIDPKDGKEKPTGAKLTEEQRRKRENFWEAVNGASESSASAPSAAPSGAKPLTDASVAADYLKRAGGDKAKARELARGDGYTF